MIETSLEHDCLTNFYYLVVCLTNYFYCSVIWFKTKPKIFETINSKTIHSIHYPTAETCIPYPSLPSPSFKCRSSSLSAMHKFIKVYFYCN
jgi:hypothetical protein